MTADDQDTTPMEGQDDVGSTTPGGKLDPKATVVMPKNGSTASGPSQVIGGYHLIKELGAGGQGAVYLVEDKKLKRQVAPKDTLRWRKPLKPSAFAFRTRSRDHQAD